MINYNYSTTETHSRVLETYECNYFLFSSDVLLTNKIYSLMLKLQHTNNKVGQLTKEGSAPGALKNILEKAGAKCSYLKL